MWVIVACAFMRNQTLRISFEKIHKASHSTNILWIIEDVPSLHKQLETSIKTSLAAIIMYHRKKEKEIKISSRGSSRAFVK